MTTRRQTKQSTNNPSDIRSSTVNFSLNILIFLLATVIIYLSYSIFIKLTKEPVVDLSAIKKETPSDIIQVEVMNGCGVNGVADRFTDYLRDHQVDVVKIGNYVQFNIEETLVIDRIGNKANAEKVGDILGVAKGNVITQKNDDYFVDVTVVIGRDYFNQTPIIKD
ncbi:MAG: LytR C-terminal domain-containing protein [Bacteroidota bacterium]